MILLQLFSRKHGIFFANLCAASISAAVGLGAHAVSSTLANWLGIFGIKHSDSIPWFYLHVLKMSYLFATRIRAPAPMPRESLNLSFLILNAQYVWFVSVWLLNINARMITWTICIQFWYWRPALITTTASLNATTALQLAPIRTALSVFRELLSLRCINLRNLCAHRQEEVLRIPKHPQLSKFAWF